MLRVLWFTNVAIPEAAAVLGIRPYLRAGWLEGYLAALRASGGVSVTVATRSSGVDRRSEVTVDGVRHILLPSRKTDVMAPPTEAHVSEYRELADSAEPDLIHYHGTECHYGMLSAGGHLATPAVLSVQGLLGECAKAYLGGLSPRELLCAHTLREIRHGEGILAGRRRFARRAVMERAILRGMEHVIGRTLWDRAHLREIHPGAVYHACDEILRPPFYTTRRIAGGFRRHSIAVSTAFYPLKGLHVLLRAAALLRRDHPDLSIRIPDSRGVLGDRSSGYVGFVRSSILRLGLAGHLEWMDPLDDRGVAALLADSHLSVTPSFLENSSNALAEAMLVGVPSVASFAGGLPSMLRDHGTGLLFPAGDHAMLAEEIRLLFARDDLAGSLAEAARAEALVRHDPARVGSVLVGIYRAVASGGASPDQALS